MESVICKIKEQLKIKQSRIEKAKSVKDFKLCDQLSDSIRSLIREKREKKKQLAAFQKNGVQVKIGTENAKSSKKQKLHPRKKYRKWQMLKISSGRMSQAKPTKLRNTKRRQR